MRTDEETIGKLAPVLSSLNHLKTVLAFHELPSTNEYAVQLEKAGQACGTVVIAAEQTCGRGRMQRQWYSSKGDIMVSILLRAQVLPRQLLMLSILPGLAMVDALLDFGAEVCLKWPNDIVFRDSKNSQIFDYFGFYRKIGGILVENVFKNNEISACIIGLGLNLVKSPQLIELIPHCGFLSQLAPRLNRDQVLSHFLVKMDELISRALDPNHLDGILSAYVSRCATVGHSVWVQQGETKIVGEAIGIDNDGALLITDGIRTHRVLAGDVQGCSR